MASLTLVRARLWVGLCAHPVGSGSRVRLGGGEEVKATDMVKRIMFSIWRGEAVLLGSQCTELATHMVRCFAHFSPGHLPVVLMLFVLHMARHLLLCFNFPAPLNLK
jgi:hypothetical protein